MINERIRSLRDFYGLNQREFAKKIDVGASTLAMFETGQRIPKDIHISRMCSEFNISEDWLRSGEGEMFPPRTRDEKMGGQFGKLYGASSFRKDMVEFFLDLSDEECDQIEKFAYKLIDFLAAKKDNND